MDINKNIKELNSNITKTVRSILPLQLQYMFGVYFLGLFFMLLYRFANFAVHCFISFSDLNIILLIRSLLIGIRFDTVVMCWMTAVFVLLMAIGTVFNINKKWYYRPLHLIICFVFAIAFFIIAADVAYFISFKNHINIIALSWIQSPSYISSLILRHPAYLLYFAVFMFSLAWYLWLMYCLYNATLFKVIPPYKQQTSLSGRLVFSLITVCLCGLGMYGRITEKQPLNVSSAYFCNSNFFNQLGVSPLFNLEKSIEEESFSVSQPLAVISGVETKRAVEEEFFSRESRPASCPVLPVPTSVVMILMQDVNLKDVNYKDMPYLTSLQSKSLNFTNVYPDGEFDYNGVFTTLFAYPNILSANSMNSTVVPKFSGITNVLSEKNYTNMFFTTYNQKNNNAVRFLYRNDFNKIIADGDLNTEDVLKELSKINKSFFACLLINNDKTNKHLKNTDKNIKQFMLASRSAAWCSNTLFVIAGCNGKERIPLIMYMPGQIKAASNPSLACQSDIAPTVLSMLDVNYIPNEMLGMNIFSSQRTYALSSYPHSIVVQDSVWKYVWRDSGYESLYYKDSDKQGVSYIKANASKAEEMKTYAFAMLQYTQYTVSQMKMQRK